MILVLFAVFAMAAPGFATHFRYGNLRWSPTGNAGEVKIEITEAYRRSFRENWGYRNGGPNLGDRISFGSMSFGDGSSTDFESEVIAVDTVNDIIVVTALNPGTGDRGIRHTYSGAGPYSLSYGACCRISNLENGDDEDFRLKTSITPTNGNSSPVSTQVPIVAVQRSSAAKFSVPAADPDGDGLRWRFATSGEAGFSNNVPPGMTINPNSGQVTWNNAALDAGPWTLQVMVEDLDGSGSVRTKVPVDFLLMIEDVTGNAPEIAISPADPISVLPGTPVTFNVHASDIDSASVINLTTSGLPGGASTSPALPISGVPGSPGATAVFHWTPTPADSGTYVVFFNVADETNQQAQASIQITVTQLPAPTVVTEPATAIGQTGATLNGTVNPNGVATSYRFEYGPSAAYGNSTAPVTAGAGVSALSVSVPITGLNLSTVYHYRLVASSAGGAAVGVNRMFTTDGIPNIPPDVSLTSPTNPTTVTEIDPVQFAATASDGDGAIAGVEFFIGTTKVGESLTAPYEITGGPFPVGTYLVTAVATDSSGVSVTSPAATLNVLEAVPLARDDHAFVAFQSRLDPLVNDDGPVGYPMTIVGVGGDPTHGTVHIIEAGRRIQYVSETPLAPDETDTFTYTVENSLGRAATATVTIHPSPPKGAQFVGYFGHDGEKHGIVSYYFGAAGRFTAKIVYDGRRYRFTGTVNGDSPLEREISLSATEVLPIQISAGPILNGSVTLHTDVPDPLGEEHWDGLAERSPYSRGGATATVDGTFTSFASPDPAHTGDADYAQGGIGMMIKNSRYGAVRIMGRTPEGRNFSESSYLLTGDHAPFFLAVGPTSRSNTLITDITFADGPDPEIAASVTWRLPAKENAKFYPQGFEVEMPMVGCRYVPPSSASGLLSSPSVTLGFADAGLLTPLSLPMTFGSKTDVFGPAPLGKSQINYRLGRVIGLLTNPDTGEGLKYYSVILQHPDLNIGMGVLVSPFLSGSVVITPSP